jgi:hypothetical protein
MQAHWVIDEATINSWRCLVDATKDTETVRQRIKQNVDRDEIDLSKSAIWRVLVGCLITTQQRSGPLSKVSQFMDPSRNLTGSALDYNACKNEPALESFLMGQLTAAGLRRAPTNAAHLAKIMATLEAGEWEPLLAHLRTLKKYTTKSKERRVARYLQSKMFPGLGPKQSRNLIQWLGLSRYEVPIDSRVLKALKANGAVFVPGARALSDETVYVFVQDALQEIANRLDIYPCVLDACIFSSFEAE